MTMQKTQMKNQDLAQEVANHADYIKKLVYVEDVDLFYIYKKEQGFYEQYSVQSFEKFTWTYLKNEYPKQQITISKIKDVVAQIKLACNRQEETLANSPYIAFADKLLHTTDFSTIPHSSSIITTFNIPYNYSELPETLAPQFQNFLNTTIVMPDYAKAQEDQSKNTPDKELQGLVQEMFGYYFINNLYASTAFFLVGMGANGKSTLADLLSDIIGLKYTTSMSIQALTTDRFATAHLVGKKLNICNEEESRFIKNDKFKTLITGEMVNAERKFGNNFDFKPTCKYLFCTNDVPTFSNLNYGVRRRIKLIPFNRIFLPAEQDKQLSRKLRQKEELMGIIAWAIEGAKRLISNNYVFNVPSTALDAVRDLENASSSAINFFRESYVVSDEDNTPSAILYDEYKEWCMRNTRKPLSAQNFSKDLHNVIDGLRQTRMYDISVQGQVRSKNCKLIEIANIPPTPEEQKATDDTVQAVDDLFKD